MQEPKPNKFQSDENQAEYIEDDETEIQRKIKKILKVVIAVFLILLILQWIIPHDVISSLIASKEMNNYSFELKNITVIFTLDFYEKLKIYYFQNQLAEFKVCLLGNISDDIYYISSFYSPKTAFATPISVHSQICSEKTLIDLHSHPFKNCLFSEQDIFSYKKTKESNPNMISAIMCDLERFSFIE